MSWVSTQNQKKTDAFREKDMVLLIPTIRGKKKNLE